MAKDRTYSDRPDTFRKEAETLFRQKPHLPHSASSEKRPELIQEHEVQLNEPDRQNEELERSRRKLSELQRENRDLYESAPCGYLTLDAGGLITRANPAAATFLKTEINNLLRSPFSTFITEDWESLFTTARRRAEETGEKQSVELPLTRTDSSLLWVQADTAPGPGENGSSNQCRITLTDISKRKKAEEALQRVMQVQGLRSAISRAILQATNEQLLLTSVCSILIREGSYLLAWAGYAQPGRANSVEPVARVVCEGGVIDTLQGIRTDSGCGQEPADTAILTGEPCVRRDLASGAEFGFRKQEAGRAGCGSSAAIPFDLDGRQCGVLNVYAADPGAFDQEELHLLTLVADDLRSAIMFLRSQEAEEKAVRSREAAEHEMEQQRMISIHTDRLRSLGAMAAGIAHELNQPLVGVRGLAEHLLLAIKRGWEINEKLADKKLQGIIDQADRMTHIIQHIRNFSREAGRPQTQPVCLNDVIEAALDLLQAQLHSRGIEIQLSLEESLPKVITNPFSLEEVILNLLTNSRDAIEDRIEQNGLTDSIHSISLSTYTGGRDETLKVILEIRDTGTGISPDKLDSVFDPFFTTKSPDMGTGLGLSISKSIIEDFGGTIELDTVQDQGTTITISLPVEDRRTAS